MPLQPTAAVVSYTLFIERNTNLHFAETAPAGATVCQSAARTCVVRPPTLPAARAVAPLVRHAPQSVPPLTNPRFRRTSHVHGTPRPHGTAGLQGTSHPPPPGSSRGNGPRACGIPPRRWRLQHPLWSVTRVRDPLRRCR